MAMDWNAIEARWRERHEPLSFSDLIERLRAADDSYDKLWRLARAAHFAAMQAHESGGDPVPHYTEGAALARRAVGMEGTGVEGHLWYGVNALEASRRRGMLASARTLPEAERHIARAMDIDEEYHFAAPVRVYGRITHFKPLLLGGSLDRAIDIYGRALQIAPHNSTTLLYYAEALLADRHRPQARAVLQKILDDADDAEWRWEQARDRRLAAKLLVEARRT